MKLWSRFGIALATVGALCAAVPAAAQEKVVVWWVKGFYPSEDAALYDAVKKFEAKTGVKVELSQLAVQDGIPKTVAALDSGTPPDVAYIDVYDFQVTGKWAYEGKLEDISDVITPNKANILPNTVETTYLYNDKAKKRAYYAFPLKQQTMHIEYWKDMLAEAGDTNIPDTWKEYWAFWCDKVQPDYRKKTGKRIFATGFPMGVDSSDSYHSFLTFMDAYNVKIVDTDGKLQVQEQEARQGIHRLPVAGRKPDALRRRLAGPLVSGDEVGRRAAVILARRSPSYVGAKAVRCGDDDVRIHEELQVHDTEQRERMGESDEPYRQRESAGGESN